MEVLASAADDIRPRRVLVVDDHADTAEVMSILFSALGHESRGVLRGRDAVKVARKFDPDIVLLDIGLPDISGYEVIRALRAADKGRKRYIVAATGWGRDIDRARARQVGFDDYLVKPIDLGKVRRVLRQASVAVGHELAVA